MYKLLLFLVRKPGMSVVEMREHYENVHMPLARKTFPQIIEHRRNWPQSDGFLFPPGADIPRYDVIGEVWFADKTGYDDMLSFLGDPNLNGEMIADEERFLDRSKCGLIVVDESIGLGARQ